MEAAKLPQRKFKILRLIFLSLVMLLVFICVSFMVLLNSQPIQKQAFDKFISPQLSNYQLEVDFKGFHYLFPNSIVIPPVDVRFNGQPLVKTGQISLQEFFFQDRVVGAREFLIDGIHVLQPIDSSLLHEFSLALSDTSSQDRPFELPIDLRLGHLEIQNIDGDFYGAHAAIGLVLEQISLDDDLGVQNIHTNIHYEGDDFAVQVDSVDWNFKENQISASFGLLSSDFGSLNGDIYYSTDSLSSAGSLVTQSKPMSKLLDLSDYSELIGATAMNFQIQSFDKVVVTEFNSSSSEFDMAGHLVYQIDVGRVSALADVYPNPSFYDIETFEEYRSILDVFSPQSLTVEFTTDFQDELSLNVEGIDKTNKISVFADKYSAPARLEATFNTLDLGPLKAARIKTALVPSISAAINGEGFSIHGVSPMIKLENDTVRGLSFSYNHTGASDSIWLSCLDENLNVEGHVNLAETAMEGQLDLHSAGLFLFDELDTGQFLSGNLSFQSDYHLIGEVRLKDILLQRTADVVFMREFNLSHSLLEDERNFTVNSDVLKADINGRWDFDDLLKISSQIGEHVLVQKGPSWIPATIDFQLDAGNVNWLTDLFHLDGYISSDSHIQGAYHGVKQKWSLDANIPEARFEHINIKDLILNSGQVKSLHRTNTKLASLRVDETLLENLALNLQGEDEEMNVRLVGLLRDSIPTNFDLSAQYGPSVFGIKSGHFNIGNSIFNFIPDGRVHWSDNTLSVDSLGFKGADGQMVFHGSLLEQGKDVLRAHINDIQSPIFNYLIRTEGVQLEGSLSGLVSVQHTLSQPLVYSNLDFKNFGLNGFSYGHLNFGARYTAEKNIIAQGQIRDKGKSSASFGATIYNASNELDARISLDDFAIDGFNPLLGGVLDELEGRLQGGVSIYGPLSDWNISGSAQLRDGHFTIPIVGAELATAEPAEIEINNSEIILDPTSFVVPNDGTKAKAWGSVHHNKFDAFDFDLRFRTDSMTAVDMSREIDAYFFGKAVVAGDLVLEGPLEQLHLDLKLATKEGTNFKIPLDNPTSVETPSFLRFITDQTESTKEEEKVALEYFTTDIAIEATDDAQLELVLDEVLGDVIKARGTGNLRLKLLEDESLELFGLYTVSSGDYLFTLQNIINKPFELLPGGTILWSGDLYEAELDLEAKYSVSTDLEGLVTSGGYNNEDVNVDLIIELSGALMSPEIGFRVELPGSPASYEQELRRHFLTEDAMNYQAFSLLMLGDFYTQDLAIQESISLGDYVSSNTSDMLVSEFGSWLAAGIGSYIDVELDYTSANPTNVLGNTNDNLNLGVSKDFFEGRLVVNSSLDIPLNQNGASTLMLGDTEVLYTLTKDGRIVLRAFNRSNRNDPLLQNTGPYTQGVGIMFQKEFEKISSKSPER